MRRVRAGVVVAGVVVALWSAIGAWASGPVDENAEHDFVTRIAGERAASGAGQLRLAADLVEVARSHSRDMAAQGRVFHNPNLGDQVKGWQVIGENVGRGPSVDDIHRAFMGSETHRREILRPGFREVGVGVVVANDSLWVTQIFREPQAGPSGPPPTAAPSPTTTAPAAPPTTAAPPATAPAAPADPPARRLAAAPRPARSAPTPTTASATVTAVPAPVAPLPTASPPSTHGFAARAALDSEPAPIELAAAERALSVPVPAVPRIPPEAGAAAALLAAVVGMQGVVVRRLGLA